MAREFISLLTNTSVFLALGAALLVYTSSIFLGVNFSLGIAAIAFFMCLAMYNLNRLTDLKEDNVSHPKRTTFVLRYRKVLIFFSMISLLIAFYISYIENVYLIFLSVLLLAISYSVKLLPKRFNYRRLKDMPLVKNITIAFTWVLITSVLVFFYSNTHLSFSVGFISIFIFIRLFINTVIFDSRDMTGDRKGEIRTIPLIMGLRRTKILLYALNTILGLSIFIFVIIGWIPFWTHLLNISTIYAYAFIYLSNRKGVDNKFLCDVIVDGEYILIGVLAFASTIIF